MRGKVSRLQMTRLVVRITPAYAGKRTQAADRKRLTRDHPRVCGEKRLEIISMHLVQGSPPRMRGKVAQAVPETYRYGITPAYAGKSYDRCVTAQADRDHPRVCGEKPRYAHWLDFPSGSPPRMRGKGQVVERANAARRITPAYAGKRRR